VAGSRSGTFSPTAVPLRCDVRKPTASVGVPGCARQGTVIRRPWQPFPGSEERVPLQPAQREEAPERRDVEGRGAVEDGGRERSLLRHAGCREPYREAELGDADPAGDRDEAREEGDGDVDYQEVGEAEVQRRRPRAGRPDQSFDKALDIYYLAIAYLATMRNWTSDAAFRIGRFLFYYRLVGVFLFEVLDSRATLLVFPNTFEYFFIAYELVSSATSRRAAAPDSGSRPPSLSGWW
jgi:hypothetical protein